MSSFTPGPWFVPPCEGNAQYLYTVATVTPRGKTKTVARIASGPQYRAFDARLIAAAPELLDALQRVLDTREAEAKAKFSADNVIANCSNPEAEIHTWERAIVAASEAEKSARAAIAKAEGHE